jgi:hypothetical protein
MSAILVATEHCVTLHVALAVKAQTN